MLAQNNSGSALSSRVEVKLGATRFPGQGKRRLTMYPEKANEWRYVAGMIGLKIWI